MGTANPVQPTNPVEPLAPLDPAEDGEPTVTAPTGDRPDPFTRGLGNDPDPV